MRRVLLVLAVLLPFTARAKPPHVLPEGEQRSAEKRLQKLFAEGEDLILKTRPLAEDLDSLRLRYTSDADIEKLDKERRGIYDRLQPMADRFMRLTNEYRRLTGSLDRRRVFEGLKNLRRDGVTKSLGEDYISSREYTKNLDALREHAHWLRDILESEQREFVGLHKRREERRDRILYASIAGVCMLLVIVLLFMWAKRPPPVRRRA